VLDGSVSSKFEWFKEDANLLARDLDVARWKVFRKYRPVG